MNYIAEVIGTALLILLGNGVVAGVVLRGTKNENAGWLVITFGWALAVTFAVYAVGAVSISQATSGYGICCTVFVHRYMVWHLVVMEAR